MTTANTCVWFEIPVTDLDRARNFYATLMGRDLQQQQQDGSPNPMVTFTSMDDPGVSGHLYPGTPAAPGSGPTIHLAAPDGLDKAAERIRENGGTVVSDPIEIPMGKFFYATDPDGNSIGLFQPA